MRETVLEIQCEQRTTWNEKKDLVETMEPLTLSKYLHFVLLASCFQSFWMLVVQIAPDSLCQPNKVFRPFQVGNVDFKHFSVHRVQLPADIERPGIVESPFTEYELFQSVQGFPNICV